MSDGFNAPQARKGVLNWFIQHPKTTISLVLLILACTFLFVFDRAAASRVQRRIAAIRAKGEPASVDDLNKLDPPIADDENMTVALMEAVKPFIALKVPEEREKNLILEGIALSGPTGEPLSPEKRLALEWYLSQNPQALLEMHAALKKEKAWFNYNRQSPMINLLLPQLSTIRKISKILAMEVRLAVDTQDAQAAGANLLDAYRGARAMDNRYPILIGTLVQIAMIAIAEDTTERAINGCPLDPAVLKTIQEELAKWPPPQGLANTLMSERVLLLDTYQCLGSKAGASALGAPVQVLRFVPAYASLDLIAGLDVYAEIVAAGGSPETEILARANKAAAMAASLPQYYLMSKYLVPSMTRAVELWLRSIGTTRALEAAIASERFRLAHGNWPKSLDELIPEFIERIPLDPFDGQPIRFAVIPEGIKTWTVGEDLTDNGGDVRRLEAFTPNKRATDFGWVLLNPELRGKVRPENPPTTSAASQN